MSLTIQGNIAASIAQRALQQSQSALDRSLHRLSTGQRATSAKDDAAAVAISSRIRGQLVSLQKYSMNVTQGTSMLQIAEGSYARAEDILNRMRALSTQALGNNLSSVERAMLDSEYQQIKQELDRIAKSTNFNGVNLFETGNLSFSSSTNTGINNSNEIVVADFDGDGVADMLELANTSVLFWKGNGDGTFAAYTQIMTGLGSVQNMEKGDFNGDGKMDFVLQTGAGTQIYSNDGNGNFAVTATFVETSTTDVRTGDFNGDGRDDVVMITGATFRIYTTNQTGGFNAAVNVALGLTSNEWQIGDMNNDGALDVIVTANSTTAQVLLNNGSGGFSTLSTFTIGATNLRRGSFADMNGDGNLDFVVGATGSANVQIALGNGNGTFTTGNSVVMSTTNNVYVQAYDYNGDGFMDIVTTDQGNNQVAWRQGTGNLTFGSLVTQALAVGTRDVILSDLNNDGKMDFLVRHTTSGSGTRIFMNGATMGMEGSFRVGENAATLNNIGFRIGSLRLNSLDGDLGVSMITNIGTAKRAEQSILRALENLSLYRTRVGAAQNRLEKTQENLATMIENQEGARSAIADLDVAQEMSRFISEQIRTQAGISMLAQAMESQRMIARLLEISAG